MQPPVSLGFLLIISKNKGGIPHFSLSPSSVCRDCPDVCNDHSIHEPCITWSFKKGQKMTYKLTRKLTGTWGVSHSANHDFMIQLQTQLPVLPCLLSPEQKGFVGSSWDPTLLFSFPNFTFLMHESRNSPKTVTLKSFGQVRSPAQTSGSCWIPAATYFTLGLDPGNSCTCL